MGDAVLKSLEWACKDNNNRHTKSVIAEAHQHSLSRHENFPSDLVPGDLSIDDLNALNIRYNFCMLPLR